MATVIDTIEKEGKTVWVYDNGMERDASNGRMVRPPTAAIITTTEKAYELQRKRQELKQERIMAGAAKVLERLGDWEAPNDLDVVEAIGEAVMENALNPDSKKQIDAARFILAEAGLSAANSRRDHESDPGDSAIVAQPAALVELAALMERELQRRLDQARAVDADVTVIRNGDGAE